MISRRSFFGLLPFVAATPARADEHPSVGFMQRVGDELLHAHRLGTASAFSRVINRFGDIATISRNSLGDNEIPGGQQARYRRGVVNYISHYMATAGREYPIAKYEIGEATVDGNKNVVVESRVYLMAGQDYGVRWHLNWNDGGYKVGDVSVLGFSLVNRERSQFENFIGKYGVPALIERLNSFG